jgi:hypothetical protein
MVGGAVMKTETIKEVMALVEASLRISKLEKLLQEIKERDINYCFGNGDFALLIEIREKIQELIGDE